MEFSQSECVNTFLAFTEITWVGHCREEKESDCEHVKPSNPESSKQHQRRAAAGPFR